MPYQTRNDFDGSAARGLCMVSPGKVGGDWHDVRVEGNGGHARLEAWDGTTWFSLDGEERQPRASGRLRAMWSILPARSWKPHARASRLRLRPQWRGRQPSCDLRDWHGDVR